MSEWWESLNVSLQIFYGIGVLSTFLLCLQLVMILVFGGGGDTDFGDMDAGTHVDHPGGLKVLSTQTTVAFFLGFGWTGAIAINFGCSTVGASLWGVAVGSFFMVTIFYLMRSLYGLRHSGTLDYNNAIGVTGTVYLPVPANQAGAGKIEVMIQGRLTVVNAYTNSDKKLENRSRVKVIEQIDPHTLLVEPVNLESKA